MPTLQPLFGSIRYVCNTYPEYCCDGTHLGNRVLQVWIRIFEPLCWRRCLTRVVRGMDLYSNARAAPHRRGHMFKPVRHIIRPAVRTATIAFLWSNRREVMRWARFIWRSARPSSWSAMDDLRVEARVRAALSCDPLLRRNSSIRDIRVRGRVVVLETPADWHNKGHAITRLEPRQRGGVGAHCR